MASVNADINNINKNNIDNINDIDNIDIDIDIDIDVLNLDNSKVGKANLSPRVFEAPIRRDLMHTVVRWQLAKRRQGTHKAKTRTEVSGGGAKPYKQKGTGNARRGSSRSPLIKGGGVIFGPSPRDYTFSLPKKIRRAAIKSALSYLYQKGNVKVVDSLSSKDGKTKSINEKMTEMGLKKSVLVGAELNDLFERATRNLPKYLYIPVEGVNVYDLLKYDTLVIEKDALSLLDKKLGVEDKS